MPNFMEQMQASAAKAANGDLSGTVGFNPVPRDPAGALGNFFSGDDPQAHNEAVYEWQRNEYSAQKAREDAWQQKQWEAFREDTQFRRKLADYAAAGFSPLSVLEGSGNYAGSYSSQAAQASGSKASPRSSSIGGLLGSVLAATAMIISKNIGATAAKADTAAKNATAHMIAQEKMNLAKERLDRNDKFRIFAKLLDKGEKEKAFEMIGSPGSAAKVAAGKAASKEVDDYVWDTVKEYKEFAKRNPGFDDIPSSWIKELDRKGKK